MLSGFTFYTGFFFGHHVSGVLIKETFCLPVILDTCSAVLLTRYQWNLMIFVTRHCYWNHTVITSLTKLSDINRYTLFMGVQEKSCTSNFGGFKFWANSELRDITSISRTIN